MRKSCTLVFLSLFSVIVVSESSWATTLRVPGDFPRIRDAVQAAQSGDTVLVAPGNYLDFFLVDKSISIISEAGASVTTIEGNPFVSVITIASTGVLIDGFTITGGGGSERGSCGGVDPNVVGGGILLLGNATIRNCRIVGNRAAANFLFQDCAFGGGIYVAGELTLFNSVVAFNQATTGNTLRAEGGGIFVQSGMAFLEGCTVSNNTSDAGADGLFGDTILHHCIVWNDAIGGNISATYCDIQGGWPGIGNIDANPSFDVDFALSRNSPCIDAGDRNYRVEPGAERDVDGNSRILDGNLSRPLVVDMGAVEFSNVYLEVTGDTNPGGTITVTTTGEPTLPVFLLVSLTPGIRALPPFGFLFFDFGAPWAAVPWIPAPSNVDLILPQGVPAPYTLVLQEVAFGAGTGNVSNDVVWVVR